MPGVFWVIIGDLLLLFMLIVPAKKFVFSTLKKKKKKAFQFYRRKARSDTISTQVSIYSILIE